MQNTGKGRISEKKTGKPTSAPISGQALPADEINEPDGPRQKNATFGHRYPADTGAANSLQYGPGAVRPEPMPPTPPLAAASVDEEDDEEMFDIYRYIGILLRRKYSIALVVVAATLFSLFRYILSDTYYIANARLLFRPDNHPHQ